MEMSIAQLATEQKAAEIGTAVGIAVLKQAQEIAGEEALTLLETVPQAPSVGAVGGTVDVSV
ncbi:MAG: YjfB family protein [Candidatus Fibromonas sp.]|jgi:predicted O-methyltransferase YrrM|nr:YjfB family protein [Candidatus Fibromonas sp.]